MWKVSSTVVTRDFERAKRALIATPDRRGPVRDPLDGVAEVSYTVSGRRAHALTVDLGEGGLSLLCGHAPELGELLRVELSGLVWEGRVRHVAPDGEIFRVGVEAA